MTTLYHYTSLSAFISIIKNNEIWVSHYSAMNDKDEFSKGYEIAKSLIKKSDAYKKADIQKVFYNFVKEVYATWPDDKYVASFSNSCDDALLYLAYCGVGSSICLACDIDRKLSQVIYEENKFKKKIEEVICKANEKLILAKSDDDFKILSDRITNDVLDLCLLYKAESFRNENEYRLIATVKDAKKDADGYCINYRANDERIIPFIKIDMSNFFSIKEVIIMSDPRESYSLKMNCLNLLHHYLPSQDPMVKPSQCGLRRK